MWTCKTRVFNDGGFLSSGGMTATYSHQGVWLRCIVSWVEHKEEANHFIEKHKPLWRRLGQVRIVYAMNVLGGRDLDSMLGRHSLLTSSLTLGNDCK